jgi:uncharacterized membrane protein YeiB
MNRQLVAPARGPVQPAERSLAPDLARGAMLLFIALANAPGLAPGGPARDASVAALELGANVLLVLFVQARAYPVFGIMLGYGMVQLARRQEAAGANPAQVRALLRRRSAWLLVFGFLHATLLYFGDFLGAYGIIGLIATAALLHRERVLRVLLWLWAVIVVELLGLASFVAIGFARYSGVPAEPPTEVPASSIASSYLASVSARLHEWPLHTLTVVPSIFIVGLGMWAAERRLLENARNHLRLLRSVAIGGLATVVLGGTPLALVYAGVHVDASTLGLTSYLHKVSGMFGGPGYVALFALIAERLTRGASSTSMRVAESLAALGACSLSAYLFQSLAWQTLLPPYALSLASRFASPLLTALGLAVAVWLLSVLGAASLRRRSWRGPAELLLRSLTYGDAAGHRRDAEPSSDDQGRVVPTRTLSARNVAPAEVPTETT